MKSRMSLLAILIVFAINCHAGQLENIHLAKAMVEAINARNLAGLDALIAPNVKRHSAATAGVTVSNLDEFKAFLTNDFAAVPNSVMEIEIIFGNDDFVALRAIYSGTQSGQMGPFPPTGKDFTLPFIGILRFENGVISEIWVEWDNVYALTQLGHLNPPE
ncbi:MAG: ester cyclase [Xanthomonadales bacterium]|nr:ester cyclase [Xanthomonadales bacterium]